MNRPPSGAPLRRRVLVSIMIVTALAVTVFALPLAVAVQRLYRTETVTALQRDAARAAAVVPDSIPGGPASLPGRLPSAPSFGVYDTAGPRGARAGPGPSAPAPRRRQAPGPHRRARRRHAAVPPPPPSP